MKIFKAAWLYISKDIKSIQVTLNTSNLEIDQKKAQQIFILEMADWLD